MGTFFSEKAYGVSVATYLVTYIPDNSGGMQRVRRQGHKTMMPQHFRLRQPV